MIATLLLNNYSLAEDSKEDKKLETTNNVEEKSQEDLEKELKFKEIELRGKKDIYNFNYYPFFNLSREAELITGATTLKFNEVFGNINFLPTLSFINTTLDNKTYTALNMDYMAIVNVGWGITDNLMLSATIPYKLTTEKNSFSNPWINLKLKVLDEPFTLAVQADAKIAPKQFITNDLLALSDSQHEFGGKLLFTKSFEELWLFDKPFLQAGLGYRYRVPVPTLNAQNEIDTDTYSWANKGLYFIELGLPFKIFEEQFLFDLTTHGNFLFDNKNSTINAISVRPNLIWKAPTIFTKFANVDLNLGFDILALKDVNSNFYLNASIGFNYKENFSYPEALINSISVFRLLLATKIDPEDIDKKEELKEIKGKTAFINNCSKCHALIKPSIYKLKEWEPIIRKYRNKKLISKSEEGAIIDFLEEYDKKFNPDTTKKEDISTEK